MREGNVTRIERNIAQCRLILAVAGPLAVYLDPSEPTLLGGRFWGAAFYLDPHALIVMLVHIAYSVALYVAVTRPRADFARLAIVSTCGDVLFGAAVALVTEGTNSPFTVYFAFAALAAGLRGTIRTSFIVTATSVALYLGLIFISRPTGLGGYVMRAVYLAITGYVVGTLGWQRSILESNLQELAHSLHDGYAQALAGVNLRVESCRELIQTGRSDEAFTELTELQAGVTREYDDLRATVRALLRLAPTPLPAVAGETRVSVHVDFDGPLAFVEHAFQIMMEGARNVGRHAGARSAAITAGRTEGAVVIRIDDDGVGFMTDASPPWSIASRAAALGGAVRVGVDGESGGHVVVELPRA